MPARRVLYFTAEDYYVYRGAGGALELEARFPGDDIGITEFREYLRGQRGALFSVVADLAGEDFYEDQIPFLRGADREAVIQRRLAQRYRDTRLAAALSLGYVSTGERRNERLLLSSFTNTQQLTPWLDALDDAGTRLAGVYSAPLLAPALARTLGARAGPAILVTANRAGLRQSFIENGRLRFARLERTVDMVPQALAMFVRSETLRMAQYLSTLRALPRDGGPLHVIVVAPPGERAVFQQALTSDNRLAFTTVDGGDAARAIGLKQAPHNAGAEALYLHLAMRKPPREQFASSDDRRGFLVWRLQRALVAVGALAFAACAVYAGGLWLQSNDLRSRAAAQSAAARSAAEQYERITATFPVTQTTTENLKTTVVEFTKIAERSSTPEIAFAHVARVLEKFPEIEIESLDWSVGRSEERRDKPPAPSSSSKPSPPGETGVRVEITGRIQTRQRDYRAISAHVQRFSDALATAGYEMLRPPQLPFDITSEGTLTGDMSAGERSQAPDFIITLGRRLP